MDVAISRHKRSKSDPVRTKIDEEKLNTNPGCSYNHKLHERQMKGCVEDDGKSPDMEVQNSVKHEILDLQKRLQDQYVVRHALEKALSCRPFSDNATNENSVPKAAMELIKEISVLELEVVNLEQYLLSLYREKFDERVVALSTMDERNRSTSIIDKKTFFKVPAHITSREENSIMQSSNLMSPQDSLENPVPLGNLIWGPKKMLDSSIQHSYSSLSQRSASFRYAPPVEFLARAVDSYHSLPLSMLEQAQNAPSNVTSLAEHLGTCSADHVRETPNWLSEEMLKCISAIYCKIADPPLVNQDYASSPSSFSSTMKDFSSRGQADIWSPQCRKLSSLSSYFENSFHIGDSKAFSGPYCTVIKVHGICRDSTKLKEIEDMLQKFESLVYRLEAVELRKMEHAEKLAFWINVHNTLVMHEFLVNGIPQNNLKRMSLLFKASYNVGGHIISVDMIQSSILGCRMPRPGQWFWPFFSSKTKFKAGGARRAYAIEHSEPLLYFALSSGSHSDPAVRMYTPKNVFPELKLANEEYIRSNITINKDHKILLPKIVESFAKDLDLCPAGLVEMIEQFIPDSHRKSIQRYEHRKFWKSTEWIPHNYSFRYLFSRELVPTP